MQDSIEDGRVGHHLVDRFGRVDARGHEMLGRVQLLERLQEGPELDVHERECVLPRGSAWERIPEEAGRPIGRPPKDLQLRLLISLPETVLATQLRQHQDFVYTLQIWPERRLRFGCRRAYRPSSHRA